MQSAHWQAAARAEQQAQTDTYCLWFAGAPLSDCPRAQPYRALRRPRRWGDLCGTKSARYQQNSAAQPSSLKALLQGLRGAAGPRRAITFRASTGAHPASELIALLEDARCADRADHAKVRCLAFGQCRPQLGLSRAEGSCERMAVMTWHSAVPDNKQTWIRLQSRPDGLTSVRGLPL